jgi:two-component system response regulator AtoC
MNRHILVIDDEEGMRVSLKNLLELNGYDVLTADSSRKALTLLQDNFVDLIVCDIVMPDMSGLSFLSKISSKVPVIMMTAFASIETARKAFKMGACDYLVKPFDFNELLIVIRQYLQASTDAACLDKEGAIHFESHNPQFQKLLRLANKISPTDMPVLILGESGTGKEVLANYIHANSLRSKSPFIKVNSAAIPETLLESELFGYEKGAFTGAINSKIGFLEKANHGTFFLDEIGDMPQSVQTKLLRVLQHFTFSRLGSTRETTIDCRIITASNQDIPRKVAMKVFREDLFYRINAAELNIPSLKSRLEDLPDLIHFFVDAFNEKYNKKIEGLDDSASWIISSYNWPGNIRELKHCLERAVVVCEDSIIHVADLPDSIINSETKMDASEMPTQHFKKDYLRNVIQATLNRTGGNKSEAAKALRVTRRTLYNWIHDLNLDYGKDS